MMAKTSRSAVAVDQRRRWRPAVAPGDRDGERGGDEERDGEVVVGGEESGLAMPMKKVPVAPPAAMRR